MMIYRKRICVGGQNSGNNQASASPTLPYKNNITFHNIFYGAASRSDAPPMPLQGVWTADNGTLPPWKGDYHNDLNTQMTYIAYQEAGRFDEGASYLNFLWNRRKVFQDFAKDFYGTGGLACPGVMSYSGQPLGGWGQYSMSPTMSAWSAHLFYLHWLYTADEKFLKEKAYPWCSGVGECMLGLLKPDEKGILKLPLSSSPEFFDNSPKAWLKPNSNCHEFDVPKNVISFPWMKWRQHATRMQKQKNGLQRHQHWVILTQKTMAHCCLMPLHRAFHPVTGDICPIS